MRFLLKVQAICLLLLVPLAGAANEAPTLLVVGDSLSAGYGLRPGEGWVSLLAQRLDREGYAYRVVNASISGDTTRGALARLPRALDVNAPALVVIELGGNDGLRGFPPEVMHDNLVEMIRLSRAAGAHVLLLGMRLPANYGADYTKKFHAVFVDIAADLEVPLLPFFLDGVALQPELIQDDGIHPNAKAQARLLENAWSSLQPLLSKDVREQ